MIPHPTMTIVLSDPSQSTLLTRRAGPAAARRPSRPYWLAWQRDPQLEVEELRKFYRREHRRAESIKRTVASRRKARAPSAQPQEADAEEEADAEADDRPPEKPHGELVLLGMYASLLESRLQSVERVSKLLSEWRDHKPLSPTPLPSSRFP